MLEIKEMVLRVPGGSEHEGRTLADDVARRVADGLPVEFRDRELGRLDLRIAVPAGAPPSATAAAVARAILGGL